MIINSNKDSDGSIVLQSENWSKFENWATFYVFGNKTQAIKIWFFKLVNHVVMLLSTKNKIIFQGK